MNADEAKTLTISSVPNLAKKAIGELLVAIRKNAENGHFSADLEISNVPTILKITNSVVEHFENKGYEVSVVDLDNSVKVSVSWYRA